MRNINIMMNILGMLVAMAGVFIEPILVRVIVVFLGVFLSSIRINE